mgnify:FL=1
MLFRSTERVDDYVMKYVRLKMNFGPQLYLSSDPARPTVSAVHLKNALTKAGYPVHGDLHIFKDKIMFQVRTPITTTAESGVAEGTTPTETASAVIKRVLGPALLWEPGDSKMYKNTRRSRTERVDDYVMMNVMINTKFAGKLKLSAKKGDQFAVDLKDALIQAGYQIGRAHV